MIIMCLITVYFPLGCFTHHNSKPLYVAHATAVEAVEQEVQVEAHPGAAVHEGARDPQHVRVLCEFQKVPLQLLFVLSHLTQFYFQPLQLFLWNIYEPERHSTPSVTSMK